MRLLFVLGLLVAVKGLDLDSFLNDVDDYLKGKISAELKSAVRDVFKEDPAAASVFSFLSSTPYIKRVGLQALEQLEFLHRYHERTGLRGGALWTNLTKLFSDNTIFNYCIRPKFFSDHPLPIPIPLQGRCCPFPHVECVKNKKYRTLDGSCNCLSSPNMGRSNRAYRRHIDPDYADGISAPRVAKDGSDLPSARLVSNIIYKAMSGKFSGFLTVLHMTLGQMVDHDTDRTPVTKLLSEDDKLVDLDCGPDDCSNTAPEDKECFPIMIPPNDPFFKKKCLKFVRSQAFMKDKCKIGPREQPNVLTSWIDVSFVYGSSKGENEPIRDTDPNRGRMKTRPNEVAPWCGPLLPTQKDKSCRDLTPKIQCFLTGDARQNEQVGVSSTHITGVRLHNYFEENLYRVNPHWSGERLFQESRRLVIAVFQNMVYQEYVSTVMGPKHMKDFSLNIKKKGCTKDHDCLNFNGDVTNSFATAAFRMGHSQITDKVRFSNAAFSQHKDLPYSTAFFRPRTLYETHFGNTTCGVEALMYGHASQRTDKADQHFTEQVTQHMFTDMPPKGVGTDLPALSTQRGRDHGLPGYTKFREFCELSVPKSFDDMDDIPHDLRMKFKNLYKHVEDIDLFAGGMAETHVYGAIVGPTFACILAKNFRDIKLADRFWFETCDKKLKFTKAQLKNIRQYTFGRYYCDTLQGIQTIQKFPMMVSRREAATNLGITRSELERRVPLYRLSNNERVPCSQHKGIDFNLWKEKKKKGKKGGKG